MDVKYDVIVAGGGPAGIAAAVAAGRGGARTLLIEKNPFAGGTWTAGGMSLVIDHLNKPGIMAEIRERLTAIGAWIPWSNWGCGLFTVEPMKILLDGMLEEAGVHIRYHTLLQGVVRDGRRIRRVVTASKSGTEAWEGRVFIDATGDGDLGAWAGCGFDKGRPSDGRMQPCTMFGLVGGWPIPAPDGSDVMAVLDRQKFDLSYRGLTIFEQAGQPSLAWLMASHLYGVDSTCAESLTQAEILGRKQVHGAVECLKKSGDPRFQNLFLICTGPFVTVREGRRIHGLHTLTADDCRKGLRFEDGICEVTFNFDVHHVRPEEGRCLDGESVPPYLVPYRSLVAKDVDNLLLSGRCISGDFLAHSSYRVTGEAVPIGEAAGMAAAIFCKEGIALPDIPASRISRLKTY